MKELVKLALDAHNGSIERYSQSEAQETLRQALIEANGGSTVLDYRAIRDGKCNGVFALVEAILRNTIPQGLEQNALFDALVDFHNIAEGDDEIFHVEDSDLFFVDDIAKGTQGIRRQRLTNVKDIPVPTKVHGIRIYEEISRILAGRVDFNDLIDKVDKSVQTKILSEIYAAWLAMTATDFGGSVYVTATAGSYSDDDLLAMIEHVEAAAGGKVAKLIGTKTALRPLATSSITFDPVKDALYNEGYVGKFLGSPTVAIPQRHKAGSTDFVYDDKTISIIASEDKPIKFVYKGDPIIVPRDFSQNMDLTQEYFLAEEWGIAVAMAGNAGIGRYQFS